jgi:hypothetical protein
MSRFHKDIVIPLFMCFAIRLSALNSRDAVMAVECFSHAVEVRRRCQQHKHVKDLV